MTKIIKYADLSDAQKKELQVLINKIVEVITSKSFPLSHG